MFFRTRKLRATDWILMTDITFNQYEPFGITTPSIAFFFGASVQLVSCLSSILVDASVPLVSRSSDLAIMISSMEGALATSGSCSTSLIESLLLSSMESMG
eukprot:CAMPEP_0194219546 /NCGR_PEP_ID=MMETSP0156-20130528/26211_1 /TAXON_ID=33649 /ORGANISM="Thalassionema nitzschioides, Strain L26-B" /LENGTH=100 /DNA_ID=CAMNT_0038949253 /DNA_START=2093 /DNA_END=2395 /DNA_ORIENTATION=+